MENNDDSDYESMSNSYSSSQPLPSWNTWTNRTILKSLAGLFLAVPVLSLTLAMINPIVSIGMESMLNQLFIGIILWSIFYKMEMDYRHVTPDRIR